MRKISMKPLSLALSLLLAITLLFSLSLSVWAETAVPGDLNGDNLITAEDITILEAVLIGSQKAQAGVNYDISGNKMVDSDDLTVLKNLVDPSQPALADKLADGETEDALSLLGTVEGAALQNAVVKGNSTQALELNGGTATVLFAATQDWSAKAALELDTLWLSGDRTVTVLLLGADGETILGTPIQVTAGENGWSRISLPLTGILSKERTKVGGITITVAADAHVYMDNLAIIVAEEAEDALTRADLENALGEIAWNWYFKGAAYDYDSTPLNSDSQPLSQPLAGYGGGKSRLTIFPSLENATSHSSVYTVCSGFAFDLYYTALGYPILGSKYNSLTMTFWRNSSYYPGYVRDAEGAYDMTVLRWHSMGKNTSYDVNTSDSTDYDTEFFTYYKDENGNIVYNNWYEKQAVIDFFNNWETNLRPGDIIVPDTPGHTLIYIGNGIVMDDNGTKYNMETGEDTREMDGSLYYNTFYDRFLNPAKTQFNIEILLGKSTNNLVVLRPLNLMLIDDGDGDPSNDRLNPDYELSAGLLKYVLSHDRTTEVKTSGYGIDEVTATRLQYPAMNIDRTVNITPYGTAAKGDTITYSVKITNNTSNDKYIAYRQAGGEAGYAGEAYENLWVVEHVPANTQLHSAPNATVVGDTLRWNITVPAGETVELTYTVTVTGEIGDTIVSGGGWVNNIPSNTITNIIGGKKLSADHQDAMASNGITNITATGTDLAEQIYKNATGQALELPEVQELMDIFYAEYKYETDYGYYLYYNSSGIKRYMYKLNAQAPTIEGKLYYDMLVPGYYGGMWCYTDELNGPSRINSLRAEYLEVGDILVYMDLTPSTDYGATSQDRVVESYTVLVYLGGGNFASVDQAGNVTTRNDAIAYTEALKHDLFLCLRPSQSYEDLSAGIPSYTITWEDAEGNVVETDEDVPYRNVPTYDGAEPAKDGYTFAGWSPAVRPADGDITYKPVFISRDLSSGKLTDSELDALAAITPETVQDAFAYYALDSVNLHAVLPWIYQQAGLSVPTELSTNKIYATRNLLFSSSGGLAANASPAAPYTTMLVTNAYGGSLMKEGAVPGFEIGYLQIGDIFCAAYDAANIDVLSSTKYYTYLYQGDGKFLSISEDSAICTVEEVLNRVYTYKDVDYNWSYFFVIRPENYNSATRNITLRNLTDAEKYALSKLTAAQVGYPSYNIKSNVIKMYSLVGISDFMTISGASFTNEDVRDRMFTTSGGRVPKAADSTNAATLHIHKMMLPCYGGSLMANTITITEAIESGVLQVGDIVAGGFVDTHDAGTSNSQFTALYQGIDETGKGKFVILYKDYTTSSSASNNVRTVIYADQLDTWNMRYYYALRPAKLAIAGDSFTVTWVNDDGTVLETDTSAVGTLPSYDGGTPVKAADAQYSYTFAGWSPATSSVNEDVTYTATYTPVLNNYTVTWLNHDGTELEIDENVPYGTTPGYGGATPTKAAADGYSYTFAGWDKEVTEVTGDVTYTATFTSARHITLHKLTDEELNILASITPKQVEAAGLNGYNLNNVAPWIYAQAGIDCSDAITLTTYWTAVQIFDKSDTWSLKSSIPAPYTTMLVTNAYGGSQMEDAPAFDINYLQIGDLFCAAFDKAQTGASSTAYSTYLYQGNGKFLLLDENASYYSWEYVLSEKYADTDEGWSYFFVIRPENYNGATRDITLRNLTDAEEYALSKLDNSVVKMGSMHLHTTLPRYFQKVGITIDMKSQTHDGTLGQLFAWSSSVGGRILVEATTDNMRYFQKMMVPCYGGTDFLETSRLTLTEAIAAHVLQVGDVIAGKYADTEAGTTASSFTALYQGNSNFLVQYHKYDADAAAQTYQTVSMTAAQIDGLTFKYYFTLRPANLATVSEDDTFTVTWVNEDGTVLETDENVALYAHPAYNGATPTKAPTAQYSFTFEGWTPVLSYVNADVTYKAVYSKTVNSYTVTWHSGSKVLATDTVPYGEVPTYTGARPYSTEKKGFAGWDKEITAVTGDVTYTATYTALRDMTAGGLTAAEKEIISNLTLNDWSSNAKSRNITSILPWIYKEAGIDITSAYGYASTSHANMNKVFAGTSTAAQSTQDYYNKILVAGSHGTNVTGVGTDDLQIGDIFAGYYTHTTSTGSSIGMYHAAVYLGKDAEGNDMFLDAYDTANADDTSRTEGKVIASFADIEANHTEDDFTTWTYRYVLRPSQLSIPHTVSWKDANGTVVATETVAYGTTYATVPTKTVNGYTYTFGDAEGAVVTADVAYTATSYVRDLSAHKLTEEEMNVFATMTPAYVKANLTYGNLDGIGPWLYQQANITLPSAVKISVHSMRNSLLAGKTSYKPGDSSYKANLGPMLVTDSYGGTQMTSNPPTFDVNYLQPGDLLCSSFFGSTNGNLYYVFLYQGNNQFLRLHKTEADYYSSEQILAMTHDFAGTQKGWTYRYVIRFEDYNGATRDIALRNLTSAESYRLSKLTTMTYPTRNLYGTMPAYYEAIGITMETTKAYRKTQEGARDMLFMWSDSVLVPREATDEATRHFQQMAVGVQGGSNFAVANRVDISDAIDSGVLQVGDILAGYHRNVYTLDVTEKSEDVVLTAMYQGNNTFLVYHFATDVSTGTQTMTRVTWTTAQIEALDFYYFYTLRPNNLAN